MPKTCYCGLKSNKRFCKYALIIPLLMYILLKRNVHKKGRGCYAFSSAIIIIREVQVNLSTRLHTLVNKQLLSSMIDHEAT